MNSSCQYIDSNLNNTVIDIYNCSSSGGHAMNIIGWDDNLEYSYCADTSYHDSNTTNCNKVVSGKGVWILKNSWGNSLQYPYLTYDSLYTNIQFIDEVQTNENKNWDNNYIIGDGNYYLKNYTFTLQDTKIQNTEKIKKIKFLAGNFDTKYNIKIKKKNGTYETFTKTNNLPGLITIDITKDIEVDENTEIIISADNEFIDKISVFTSNIDSDPEIDLSKYDNTTIVYDNMRLYSNTKNIPSGATITYKVYDSSEQEVSNQFVFTNNIVAENNINTSVAFPSNLDNNTYRIDAIYNSNVVESIHVNTTKMDGNGTKNNPYIITNAIQLYQMRNHLYAYYELANDIDLTEDTHEGGSLSFASSTCPQGFGWESINGFGGSLDGKGHTIKGLYQNNYLTCNEEKETWYELNKKGNGLFGSLTGDATIKNLVLEDFDITCIGSDCGILSSKYIDSITDSGEVDWSDDTEYTATFENIAVKNCKTKGVYNNYTKVVPTGGGLFGSIFSGNGNIIISNIYLDISINSKEIKDSGSLIRDIQSKNTTIQNIRVMRDIAGKANDGSYGEVALINNIVGDNSFSIKNVLSTVTATNVAASLIYLSYNDKLTLDSINLIDVNKPLCSQNNMCSDNNNINVFNKDTQIREFTKTNNYNTWEGFNTNWVTKTIDGIARMPALKFMNFEYTHIDDIELNQELNQKRSIYDYITPKIDAAKRIIYHSNDNNIIKIDENGILIPQSSGNATIHVESLYDGFIKNVPVSVTYLPHYTIHFDANGGEGNMESIEFQTGMNGTLPENQFTRDHYEFNGWNTKADGTGTSYSDLSQIPAMNDKETLTLYAQWIGEELIVTFDPNGGTVIPERKIVHYGDIYGELPIPVRNGYAFDHWSNNNGTVSALHKVNGLKLKASWKENAFGMLYDANGGEYNDKYYSNQVQVLSASKLYEYVYYSNMSLLSGDWYKRDGYKFKEWNTKADGTGKSYKENTDINTNDIDNNNIITLYAIWEEKRIELTATPPSLDYGEVFANFTTMIKKNVTIKNVGDEDVTLTINNPTNVGPFGSSSFENGKLLKPDETYQISLMINPNGTNHDKPGAYNGIYKITATSVEDTDNKYVLEIPAQVVIKKNPQAIAYKTHVQSYGWQDYVRNGTMSGTSGEGKRLEGIKIKLENQSYDGNILYRTHIQSYGWETTWKKNDQMSGTSGEGKRLEAIEIKLDGDMKDHYDIYYRVHAQSFGWLGWAKNGEQSGTAGYAKRLEAIEIKLVEKDTPVSGYGEKDAFKDKNAVESVSLNKTTISIEAGDETTLTATVLPEDATNKTLTWTSNNESSVTVEQNGHITAVAEGTAIITAKANNGKKATCTVNVLSPIPGVAYQTHVQSYGWQDYVSNGKMSGTSGEAKRLEGIKIKLKNQEYDGDIEYKTHIQSYGWETTWKKNAQMSGTSGEAKRLEAIQIRLTNQMAIQYDIYYRVHAQSFGWLGWAKNGKSAGTAGYAKRLEGIEIVLVEKGGKPPARANQNREEPFIEN